jgi:hypothetical protein
MRCASCGSMLQPSAEFCINMRCAAFKVPIPPERRATVSRPLAPLSPMRPLANLATAVNVCVAFAGVATAIAVPTGRLASDPGLTVGWALGELLILGVALAGAGFFVAWLYQARRNLDALRDADPSWSVGWTIASLFVPVVNLVLPGFVMFEVAQQSLPRPDEQGRRRIGLIARAWWIVSVFALAMLTEVDVAAPDPTTVYLAALLVLVSAAACVVLVREVSTAQAHRFAV